MSNKFEKLIEYVINEEEAKASDLFHEIVVEKSRDIYESLMDQDNFGGDQADELVNDIAADEEGMSEAEDDDMMAPEIGDEAGESHNDFDDSGDMDSHEMDHVAGDEEDAELEDRVVDLEDQLDSLMAEFDSMMGGDEGMGDEMGMEPEMGDDMGMDAEMGGDMGMEPELEGFNENVALTKVTKGISNSTESEGTNKTTVNADNSGKKGLGAVAKPHQTTGEEGNVATPSVKPGDGTTEPNESKVTEPKKKGEDAGVNKKSLSGS